MAWVGVIAWTERRFEGRPLLWVSLGIVAGLVINPYFPQNLELIYEHARIKLTLSDYDTKVGGEWYPYDSWEFLGNALVACISMVVGYIAFDPADRKSAQHPLLFAILATALMIMMAKWRRIAEYWPPFAVMFAAFSLQTWLVGGRATFPRLPPDIMQELEPFLDRNTTTQSVDDWSAVEIIKMVSVVLIALFLSTALFFNLRAAAKDIRQSEPHEYYQRGAEWLKAHVPPGHIIFNTDWDDFPRLFYYDTDHYYVTGLDPSYLYDKNPGLSQHADAASEDRPSEQGRAPPWCCIAAGDHNAPNPHRNNLLGVHRDVLHTGRNGDTPCSRRILPAHIRHERDVPASLYSRRRHEKLSNYR
jgi:hypothetical protein